MFFKTRHSLFATFAARASTFYYYLCFFIQIAIGELILFHRNIFQTLNYIALVAVKMSMFWFVFKRFVKRIFYQLIIYNNLVNNIVFHQRFKRPVKSCSIVIAR